MHFPGLGRSPGEGNGSPLQSSCLENTVDRGAWRAIVHGVTKSQTQLKVTWHSPVTSEFQTNYEYCFLVYVPGVAWDILTLKKCFHWLSAIGI